jgi:hypothetical protein
MGVGFYGTLKVRLGGNLIGGGGTLIGVDTLRYRDVKELKK